MKQDFIRDNPQIIQALRESRNRKADALMEEAERSSITFSPAFERKMERLIRAQRKPYYPLIRTNGRKTLLALAAVLIIMLSLVFSVSALRKPFTKFCVEVFEKFSSLFYDQTEMTVPLPTALEKFYAPEFIPEGYKLDAENSIVLNSQRIFQYVSADGNVIEFQQFLLGTNVFTINTEGIQTEEVFIKGYVGLYYSDLGKQALVWDNGQYGFSLIGPVDKATLLAVAHSLKEK